MVSRYILILLGVISLFWIGYVGVNLIDTNDEYNPDCFFGQKDGEVLVINRLDEFDVESIQFQVSKNGLNLFKEIEKKIKRGNTVYLSKLQNQFLVVKKDKWTKEEVEQLFLNSTFKIEFLNNSKFKVQNFSGDFNSTILHLYDDNVEYPKKSNSAWMTFDHKASASIIKFKNGQNNYSINDVYVNKNGSIEYITKGNKLNEGKQIDDEDLFSQAIPKSVRSYHFYEKNYYSSLDLNYKKGPMHYWIESGFVELVYDNEKVLITDFVDSKDPFLLLNEINKDENEDIEESSTYFKNIRLTNNFPEDLEKGFYIYKMDDFIILSSSKSICNEILMASKKTETTNDSTSFFLKALPRKVSERFISKDHNYSKSIYKNKIIETIVN